MGSKLIQMKGKMLKFFIWTVQHLLMFCWFMILVYIFDQVINSKCWTPLLYFFEKHGPWKDHHTNGEYDSLAFFIIVSLVRSWLQVANIGGTDWINDR